MAKMFKVWPVRSKRINNQVLSPDMVVIVTMRYESVTPFSNGAVELKDALWRIYRFDYKQAGCTPGDFKYIALA